MVGVCNVTDCSRPSTSFCASCTFHYNEWLATQPTYKGIHAKIKNVRGPAKDHECLGCSLMAQDWAYIHGDIFEKYHRTNTGNKLAFSLKTTYYIPLCKQCHSVFDRKEDPQLDKLARWLRKLDTEN